MNGQRDLNCTSHDNSAEEQKPNLHSRISLNTDKIFSHINVQTYRESFQKYHCLIKHKMYNKRRIFANEIFFTIELT